MRGPVVVRAVALGLLALGTTGCGAAGIREEADQEGVGPGALRVVATTPIIADLVRQVGGEHVRASSLVPEQGDPHSYEPTPADAGRIARADVTFTNHLLLEEHALIRAIDANAPEGAPNVSLAEGSEAYGAHVLPLVEDVGVDVPWLGLRVRGDGRALGATRSSEVILEATRATGPGSMAAYRTSALGDPELLFGSDDGLAPGRDRATLPPAAHTHLNWAFTRPGVHTLTLRARLRAAGRPSGPPIATGTFRFAVGVDPDRVRVPGRRAVVRTGHTDLTVDLDRAALYAFSDADGSGREQTVVDPDDAVIEVPDRARETVPDDRRFGFLGRPGARVHQLPQAVLGKHVHGEIDPHLWQDVTNAKAYVQIVRDTLAREAPQHADAFRRRAAAYARRLDALDALVRRTIATIPAERRRLVTTHDAFGYLADAYGLRVAGFVVPNPAQEPSAQGVRRLGRTIRDLRVPAVFLEPNLARRATVLQQVADDHDVRVCRLYGDAFDDERRDYVAMMTFNARELARCLGGRS